MVWEPKKSEELSGSPVAETLRAELSEACGDLPEGDTFPLEEVATAVVRYMDGPQRRLSCDRPAAMAARALKSLGEARLGKRVLIFGAGMVRESRWDVVGKEPLWVIDFGRMFSGVALEMGLFRWVSAVLEEMSSRLDETGGEGVIGLLNLSEAVRSVLGTNERIRTRALADEVGGLCGTRLVRVAVQRGWRHVPRVMNLDQ